MSGDTWQKARRDDDDETKRSRSPASRPVPDTNTDFSVQSPVQPSPSTSPTSPQNGNDDAFMVSAGYEPNTGLPVEQRTSSDSAQRKTVTFDDEPQSSGASGSTGRS